MAILTVETKSEEKSLYEILIAQAKGKAAPKKKVEEDDDDVDDEPAPKKSGKAAKGEDDDDDVDEEDDKWNKEDEGEDWDPEFGELDGGKARGRKGGSPGGKKPADDD